MHTYTISETVKQVADNIQWMIDSPCGIDKEYLQIYVNRLYKACADDAAHYKHKEEVQALESYHHQLSAEIRATLTTSEAAKYLNRKAGTLRQWAFQGNGPLQPQRINGRLAWPVDEIKKLLGA